MDQPPPFSSLILHPLNEQMYGKLLVNSNPEHKKRILIIMDCINLPQINSKSYQLLFIDSVVNGGMGDRGIVQCSFNLNIVQFIRLADVAAAVTWIWMQMEFDIYFYLFFGGRAKSKNHHKSQREWKTFHQFVPGNIRFKHKLIQCVLCRWVTNRKKRERIPWTERHCAMQMLNNYCLAAEYRKKWNKRWFRSDSMRWRGGSIALGKKNGTKKTFRCGIRWWNGIPILLFAAECAASTQ